MTEFIRIIGGSPLSGTVRAGGAKNAALPLLIGSLLTRERCVFKNVPLLRDVSLTFHLLKQFGAEVDYSNETVSVQVEKLTATEASYSVVKAMRASFWVLGPLLARGGAARVAMPGGDIIGARPVDMHLAALAKMGADIRIKNGVVHALAPNGLRPAEIDLRFPSVGATHQVLLAAALTPGLTVIRGAACEPEIVAVAEFINALGGSVQGAGTAEIEIQGEEELGGASIEVIGDRIEAATYLLAALVTRGRIEVTGIAPEYFGEFLPILEEAGCGIVLGVNSVSLDARGKTIKPISVSTSPFPKLATDMQAPLMAAFTTVSGRSVIEETVFEGRFGHVAELCRMGAAITVQGNHAEIDGISELKGAPVESMDIRGAAALVVAAVAADGVTEIHEPHHIYRGYSNLVEKLSGLGATISTAIHDAEDHYFAGC